MFEVLRKKSSPRVKRTGLSAWFIVGTLLASYGFYKAWFETEPVGIGFVILFVMTLLFWVLPTGLLLWLDIKENNKIK